jgi:Lectin C-type domain/Tyrosine-protein kinase ephrin type A/B receptor-like
MYIAYYSVNKRYGGTGSAFLGKSLSGVPMNGELFYLTISDMVLMNNDRLIAEAQLATSCSVCPQYSSSTVGIMTCTCDAGTSQYGTGFSLVCTPCLPGEYSWKGSSSCFFCGENTYTAVSGASACTQCPNNSYALAGASTCLCNPGFASSGYGDSLTCTECSQNSFDACPDGYSTADGLESCYQYVSTGLTWSAAAAACASSGGWLAVVHNKAENNFINDLTGFASHAWLGANDQAVVFQWQWPGGRHSSFTNWGPSQPDNYLNRERCLEMQSTGSWNDLDCGATQGYVCETRFASSCNNCSSNSHAINGSTSCVCNDGYAQVGFGNDVQCSPCQPGTFHSPAYGVCLRSVAAAVVAVGVVVS